MPPVWRERESGIGRYRRLPAPRRPLLLLTASRCADRRNEKAWQWPHASPLSCVKVFFTFSWEASIIQAGISTTPREA